MPFGKKPSFIESLKQLQGKRERFNLIIGGWPTRIRNEQEGLAVRKLWDEALSEARALTKQQPTSLEAKFVLADLLRMGHNIDVPGAAQASYTLLQEIIQANPDHFGAHNSLAILFLAINPQTAPQAETHFLKAEALAAPHVIPDIYQGLGFACLYQDKTPEAIAYFEKFLQYREDTQIQKMVEALKADVKPRITYQDLPDNS
ncbi:MAG: hypothetical protein GC204_15300 [Chloroflexi bacterium]|nr:hypothetical protein [Chloroflexota bacterium]